jgi:hypothetical protein
MPDQAGIERAGGLVARDAGEYRATIARRLGGEHAIDPRSAQRTRPDRIAAGVDANQVKVSLAGPIAGRLSRDDVPAVGGLVESPGELVVGATIGARPQRVAVRVGANHVDIVAAGAETVSEADDDIPAVPSV